MSTPKALSGLLLALFVSTLSSTVVSTALPRMIGDLHGTQSQYTWVVTATLLAATAATPIWGKLADLFSKKALVQIAIAAMIPPRERGRYSGYLSSVTAVSTIGGPLLGGVIVDTAWLGWRWCFFIAIPFAIAALILLQLTLRIATVRRDNVTIDYAGATLITAGVSLLLIWISFVDDAFAWLSWQTFAMAGGALTLLLLAAWVETRAAEPIVPPRILRSRTTALAILGSLAAGTAMYGAAVFLTQYFQLSRGHTPTQAGLLTIPMMAGILIASIVAGRLITRTGHLKPFVVTGAVSLTTGFVLLGLIDVGTPIALIAVAMVLVGAGVGMTLQNFVLVVQNVVPLSDIGAASSTVAFFRSLGGTIGVAVLGAVLARQVASSTAAGTSPATAFGDATGQVFLISAGVATLGIVAAVLLKPVTLRTSLDVPQAAPTLDQVTIGPRRET
ncbi:MFS transporter [Winogradskya humida]|uniref:EmrB/QacA family drug resistance transporter n=1 Tax=Winogradskya humida TaxID=113566 RepID=A0ABQ4A1F5_9ACTN|nr:MFS transporter [Actinoplanes humidus]GIE24676.1 EmrB/QacA family drug resistance transporter [Actinoplanes humidus]